MTFCNSLSHRDSTFTPELARGPMHFCSAREGLYCLCPCFFAHALPSPSLSCFSVKHLASSGDDSGGPCTYTLSTMDQCGSIMVLPVLTYKSILNEERMGHCTRFHKSCSGEPLLVYKLALDMTSGLSQVAFFC